MAWEKQKPSYQNLIRDVPVISVRSKGGVAWNSHTQELLGWPEFVELLFDKEAGLLGLRPVPEDGIGAFVVRKHGGNSFRIGAIKALRQVGMLGTLLRGMARLEDGVVLIDAKGMLNGRRQRCESGERRHAGRRWYRCNARPYTGRRDYGSCG